MILIYADAISPRLKYTCSLLFADVLAMPFSFTTSITQFENSPLPKLNYSKNKSVSGLFMESVDLLFETQLKKQTLAIKNNGENAFFFSSSAASDFEFDIFAAAFYLVTRYEEYTDFTADKHGRFEITASLAYHHGFLQQPLVNKWAGLLKEKLTNAYPVLKFTPAKFSYLSTIDVDNGYRYRGKGIIRTLGAMLKESIKGDIASVTERITSILGLKPDPFDKYELQKQLNEKYGTKLTYFFLFAVKAKYDGGLSPKSKIYHQLIKNIGKYADTGIHPSYRSNNSTAILKNEVAGFFKAAGHNSGKSRQHFLKFKLPESYNNLIDAGIREDYSMGYASHHGFRASICTPYYFYDLKQEKSTSLKIIPVAVMDNSLMEHQQMTSLQAIEAINALMAGVAKVNGLFVSISHERFFSDYPYYKGWLWVYEEMLKTAEQFSKNNPD